MWRATGVHFGLSLFPRPESLPDLHGGGAKAIEGDMCIACLESSPLRVSAPCRSYVAGILMQVAVGFMALKRSIWCC